MDNYNFTIKLSQSCEYLNDDQFNLLIASNY